jgi:hypothetical protein
MESPPKPTLLMILSSLRAAHENLLELTEDDMKELGDVQKNKADDIVELLEAMDMNIARLKANVDLFASAKKHLENNKTSLKDHVKFSMNATQMECVNGNRRSLKLGRRAVFKVYRDPQESDMVIYPGLVQRRITIDYSWDEIALKQALSDGKPDVSNVCGYEESLVLTTPVVKLPPKGLSGAHL